MNKLFGKAANAAYGNGIVIKDNQHQIKIYKQSMTLNNHSHFLLPSWIK